MFSSSASLRSNVDTLTAVNLLQVPTVQCTLVVFFPIEIIVLAALHFRSQWAHIP